MPAGARITPATAVNLAKIRSSNTYTALATQPYAHHYVLQLLDFAANVGGYGEVLSLGDGSNAQNTLAHGAARYLRRPRLHPWRRIRPEARHRPQQRLDHDPRILHRRTSGHVGQDSQAIAGWNGPGPYTITNNYLEAASENFLLGGADPAIPDLIPSDITFTKNYVTKPLSWRSRTDINVKNLFELKNAQRVTD